MKASKEMQTYFGEIQKNISKEFEIAQQARKKGFDPEQYVDIRLARDLVERVEGLISVVAPGLVGSGMTKRLRELENEYGPQDWRVALKIAEEVALEKFCKFKDKKEAMEVGMRVGFAYHTVGVVSAPLEGITDLMIKKTRKGEEYFALKYAGPIRGAGGTGAAFSLLIADYVRSKMGYAKYDADENETNRMITELGDYHERITNLQYNASSKELAFLVKNCPVEIDGDPTEKIQVSNFKDLPRIETNKIRGGVCLVLSMLALKAPKLWKQLSKWGKDFGLDWEWLEEFLKIQKEAKAGGQAKKSENEQYQLTPDYTYIKDLVAGRPVLTHPLRHGGFRLRYGRTRTTGYSATAIHPATMLCLDKFIATGTQLKTERPGKATSITVCDSIEGPIVKFKDGSVAQLNQSSIDKQTLKEVDKILFLGDILISFGDFFDRAHNLVPAGYCEEWWLQELEKAAKNSEMLIDENLSESLPDKISEFISKHSAIEKEKVKKELSDPRTISIFTSLFLSSKFGIPLPPKYSYFWSALTKEEFNLLLEWLSHKKIVFHEEEIEKIVLPKHPAKEFLERIGMPHIMAANEFVVIEREHAISLINQLNMMEEDSLNRAKELSNELKPLDVINKISKFKVRDRSGTFIGARMGRPEKAKQRMLTGSPQVLFPVGKQGGVRRSFQSAIEEGHVEADFPLYKCSCGNETVLSVCEKCWEKTIRLYLCPLCGLMPNKECQVHGLNKEFAKKRVKINELINDIRKKIGMNVLPELVKGVRGTSNKEHIPENPAKGFLRAKHNIYVNKDGTTRYDMTELPLTHFKPKEIGTSIERLRDLGYEKDIKGEELKDEDQVLEIKPQDIILPACDLSPDESADEVLFRVANFVDELLESFYGLPKYYGFKNKKELVGHLVIGIAPHISAGMVGRIIGFSKTQGMYCSPLFHAAMRRDCLSYDTYVPIRINDEWEIRQIGDLVEDFNPNILVDYFGTLKRDVDNLATCSNPSIGQIKEVTKHEPAPMVEIHLEDGRIIKATKDHKFFTKGKKQVRASNLNSESKLMVGYQRDINEKDIEELFLPEIFKNKEYVMIKNICDYLSSFAKISKHQNYAFRDSFPIALVEEILGKNGKTLKDLPESARISIKRDSISMPVKIPLSNELLEVMGLYIADGHIRHGNDPEKGFYQLEIAGNKEVRDKVKKVMLDHFGLKHSQETEEKITFSSRILHELFKNYLKTGEWPYRKRIPPTFLNLKKEKIAALLRGYYEGDGSVSISDIRVTCDTVSEGLKQDLSFVLSRFGIYTRFYRYKTKPGKKVMEFYKNKEVPETKMIKIIIPSNFVKKFKQIGFLSERKNNILEKLCLRNPRGMKIDFDETYAYPQVKKIIEIGEYSSYCFNVAQEHNFFANDILVKNCDGDEACVILLMDAFLNFSRNFLPDRIGARTMDSPLVLTSLLDPAEVDDMVHRLDIPWKYPLAMYEAALQYKKPWDESFKVELLGEHLNTERQYEGLGYTHQVSDMNAGVRCSDYKLLPSMQEKLTGQMILAEKIMAVDEHDVARLVIEKHFIRDIRGNLRKFSFQKFRCVKCNEKYRRPPLAGKCKKCDSNIMFTISEGSVVKYLEPSMSLASKYDVGSYLKQTLELTKRRIEEVFGKDKEKQEGLGRWFG